MKSRATLRYLIAWWLLLLALPAIAEPNNWVTTGSMAVPRESATATLLPSGKVLVAGGYNRTSGALASAELYDPQTGVWHAAANLHSQRTNATAVLLPTGQVLMAGGYNKTDGFLASAELYDPAQDAWRPAGSLPVALSNTTAVLLPSGKVLVAGGYNAHGAIAAAELYDPASNDWTPVKPLPKPRSDAMVISLPSGNVMFIGGWGEIRASGGASLNGWTGGWGLSTSNLASVVIYDPAHDQWNEAASLAVSRQGASAALLPSGDILVTGGISEGDPLQLTEIYDAKTNTWSASRRKVGSTHVIGDEYSDVWELTDKSLATERANATTTVLPSGEVLMAGGTGSDTHGAVVFNPATQSWRDAGQLSTMRSNATATLLPSGKVLVAGGGNRDNILASAELFDPASYASAEEGQLRFARTGAAAIRLPSGKVLVVGGRDGNSALSKAISSTELYDPVTNTWRQTSSLNKARSGAKALLLDSGKVLLVGGNNSACCSVTQDTELYDPAQDKWSTVAPLTDPRSHGNDIRRGPTNATATLLTSGRVLIAGGWDYGIRHTDAEVYDPDSNSWQAAAALGTPRASDAPTIRLASGKVMVIGGGLGDGGTNSRFLPSTEIYDPATNQWAPAAPLTTGRKGATATLLASGKVLVVGGISGGWNKLGGWSKPSIVASAELYDPATNAWSPAGSLATPRTGYASVLLPSGKLLVVGGHDSDRVVLNSAELYDPVTNTWSPAAPLATARQNATATLLPSGMVLVVGGDDSSHPFSSTELYDPKANVWIPGESYHPPARTGH